MSDRKGLGTALVAIVLLVLGFFLGALGAAWRQREVRADPWRKMRVDQEGTEGVTTRTRVVIENPALPVQAVELTRSPEGVPDLARITLRDGRELTLRYQGDRRPTSLEASDGSKATITYEGDKARVDFVAKDRKEIGTKRVSVPAELRSALRQALAEPSTDEPSDLLERLAGLVASDAFAQQPQPPADEQVAVVRHVEARLDVRTPGVTNPPGTAQVEANCPPAACVPVTSQAAMPGQTTVRVAVSGSAKRSELAKPASPAALEPFKKTAVAERTMAQRILPDVASAVAAVGVTAMACKSLKLSAPSCVPELAKTTTSGAAVLGISKYAVPTTGRVVDTRAEALFYIEQARAKLDREIAVELCLGREGFVRACTEIKGRPFGAQPMARVDRTLDMRKGIGGNFAGSFELSQQDGADCKFSPSPKTDGPLRFSFDNEKNTLTASLRSEKRGSRPDLRCSLGTANMAWSQTYTITATQTFTAQQLSAGGKLPLRLTGTMNGVGNYSFSNCRTGGGASAGCPGGKSDGYAYPVEIVGELDSSAQTGAGQILVQNAPLPTTGTWRVPAATPSPGSP